MAGLTKTAARNLKAELARRNKTRADLANAWGCTLKTAGQRLNGSISMTIKEVEEAAPVFGMDSTQLLMLLIQPLDSIRQFKP